MSDTSPEMEMRYRAMLLSRSEAERLAVSSAMFRMTRQIVIASIRRDKPGIGEVELRQELFLRYYGHEFGPDQRERILAGIANAWERAHS